MSSRTKIICTMGPAVNNEKTIGELIDAGMNVARINFSHGTHEDHKKTIDTLKKVRESKEVPLAILLDTKGPEIRVGVLEREVTVKAGEEILLTKDGSGLPITPGIALDALEVDNRVLFDDGYITSVVTEKTDSGIRVRILNPGTIKSQKGVNLPHVDVPLPALTERDIEDIKFGIEQGVDLIAASFIRSANHVREIKGLLYEYDAAEIPIIAKIENGLGVQNFESILAAADGIMVARGDLGVELPIEQVPALQKMMILKCVQASKPVITATQMLESMMHSPRPTRAEASDVANAIYDSTSAVMLSGETAVGKYPVETVQLMRRIIEETERDIPFQKQRAPGGSYDITTSVALASVKTAYSAGAKAIFTYTATGSTARLIASFRPGMPIFALTASYATYHRLSLSWGVIPVPPSNVETALEALSATSDFACKRGLVQFGDLVVITSGSPFAVKGTTNAMIIHSIGEVLVRGQETHGPEVSGEVRIVLAPDSLSIKAAKGKIVVITTFDDTYIPIIAESKAVLLQNAPDDEKSEEQAKKIAEELGIPILLRADGATRRLNDGQEVTLLPEKGAVYRKK